MAATSLYFLTLQQRVDAGTCRSLTAADLGMESADLEQTINRVRDQHFSSLDLSIDANKELVKSFITTRRIRELREEAKRSRQAASRKAAPGRAGEAATERIEDLKEYVGSFKQKFNKLVRNYDVTLKPGNDFTTDAKLSDQQKVSEAKIQVARLAIIDFLNQGKVLFGGMKQFEMACFHPERREQPVEHFLKILNAGELCHNAISKDVALPLLGRFSIPSDLMDT
jgi:uncharacterized protein YnzC (UPF0291/DUF896 family)